MKRFGLVMVALAAVAAVKAQTDYTPVNLSIRGGAAYIFDDVTRRLTGTMFTAGIDYFIDTKWFKNSETSLSIDWYGKSGNGTKGNMFPVMLNQRFYQKGREVGHRTYGFFGLGAVSVDITKAKTVLGARFGYGVELGPALFTEGVLLISDEANGARANNIAWYIGYRF